MNEPTDDKPEEVETFELDDDGPDLSHHQERDAILAEVMRHQAALEERLEEYRERVEKTRAYGIKHIVLTVALTMAAWIWILPPSQLHIERTPQPNIVAEEAALRLAMYFQAQRVEQYVQDFGRTPPELGAAGPVFEGMDYIRLTDREYRILGRTERISISYSSADSLLDFVGLGASVLDVTVLP